MREPQMFEDQGFRWNEDVIEALPAPEVEAILLRDAREEMAAGEWDVAYGILRELVWRFPENREGWRLLAEMARRLGKVDEAAEAARRST